jgi:hypothetical protein
MNHSTIRRSRAFGAVIALTGALTLLLSACSSSVPESELELPEKNISEWVTPLDQYVPGHSELANYAEQLLIGKCMTARGLSWDVPWRDIHADNGPSWNAIDRRLFNADLASEYGYHNGPSGDSSLQAWQQFAAEKQRLNAVDDKGVTDCVPVAREELPLLSTSASQKALMLVQNAFDDAKNSGEVRTAAEKWRDCMEPEGVADLPDTPADMPSKSLTKRFKLDFGDRLGTSEVTTAEIAIATADAKCQDSSGYAEALYEAEWKKSASLVRENADELVRARNEIRANETAVLDVISSNAPAQ